MPLVKPRKNETKKNFISRCMSDKVMRKEFPKANQRRAVCERQWDTKKQEDNVDTKLGKMKGKDLFLSFDEVSFEEVDGNANELVISLVARTNTAVDTFLGPMVHDFKGMFHKDRIPLDWRHDSDELSGYLDTFDTKNARLTCSGKIISVQEDDRPSRIIKQVKAGIPFEASIFFGGQGIKVEEIGVGTSTSVNGKKLEGPAIVVREWPLRAVALCPYGRDSNTVVNSKMSEEEVEVQFFTFKERPMNDETNAANEAEAQKIKELEKKEKKLQEELKLKEKEEKEKKELAEKNIVNLPTSSDGKIGSDFIEAYGEKGAVWFTEGKTFTEAATLHTNALVERVKKLEKKLAAIDIGSDDPADSSEPGDDGDPKKAAELAERAEKVKKLTPKIGVAAAKFAASIKLPKRTN